MITTTLNDILRHDPCLDGWEKLLAYLGTTEPDDEPLALSVILDSNGLEDALWALRTLGPDSESWIRLMACDMVEPALRYTDDERAHEAVRVARRFAWGECDADELAAAGAAAGDAAGVAARAAVWAAAGAAAGAAARAAARKGQEAIFLRYVEAENDA